MKALSLNLCSCVWGERKNADMRQAGKERGTECGNCKTGFGRAKEDDAAGQSRFRDPTKSFTTWLNYAVSYGLVCA